MRIGATLLALLLAAAAARASFIENRGSDAIDFYLFWQVGQSAGEVRDPWSDAGRRALALLGARAQQDPAASPGLRAAARHTSLEATATPLLYASFRAFSTGDYELDYALFHLLSLACACAALLILGATFRWPSWATLLAIAALLRVAAPLASDAWVGNVNQIQLAALAALIALSRAPPRPVIAAAAGVLAALLVLFKPNLLPVPLALLALWLGRRQWRRAAWCAAAAAVAAALAMVASSRVFGPGAWAAWARSAAELAQDVTLTAAAGNLSLSHALGASASLSNAAAAVLVLVSLACAFRARDAVDGEVGATGAAVAAPLLCATLAWQHYFLLLTPALLYLLRPSRRWTFAAGVAAVALLWVVPHAVHSARAIALSAGVAAALVLCASLALLTPTASRS